MYIGFYVECLDLGVSSIVFVAILNIGLPYIPLTGLRASNLM